MWCLFLQRGDSEDRASYIVSDSGMFFFKYLPKLPVWKVLAPGPCNNSKQLRVLKTLHLWKELESKRIQTEDTVVCPRYGNASGGKEKPEALSEENDLLYSDVSVRNSSVILSRASPVIPTTHCEFLIWYNFWLFSQSSYSSHFFWMLYVQCFDVYLAHAICSFTFTWSVLNKLTLSTKRATVDHSP